MPTHTHHSAADLAEWNAYAAATRTAADAVASAVLYASTGQRYGACAEVARPVLLSAEISDMYLTSMPWGPAVLGSGVWINLPLPASNTRIDYTRVRLRGPVNAVTSVKIDGVVFGAANYRLDERLDLVRIDGQTWPMWQDLSVPSNAVGAFAVEYTRGIPVPAAVLAAAGTYALEWCRASSPNSATLCRLPSRAKDITRQGVTISMVDPTTLLENGLTGLPEIDGLIVALNPTRLHKQPRVLVPGDTAPVVSV